MGKEEDLREDICVNLMALVSRLFLFFFSLKRKIICHNSVKSIFFPFKLKS